MENPFFRKKETIKIVAAVAVALVVCAFFYRQILLALQLILGGWVIAFLLEPMDAKFRGHMKHALSVTLSFAVVIVCVALLLLLLIPTMVVQMGEVIRTFPATMEYLTETLDKVNAWLAARHLMQINMPEMDMGAITGGLNAVMSGTVGFAGSMVDGLTKFGVMMMLSFYFLLDKDKLLLQLELLVPSASRKLVLRIAGGITRELRIYIRGQGIIALIVGVLTSIGFALIGMPSYLLLGVFVGVFNMIPYFGSLIGGIPAVLLALGKDFPAVLLALLVLFTVQQLDGFIISPRVMSGVTGMSPPIVLIAITLGGNLGGVFGMLFAIPCLLIAKISLRVWVSRNEMIEIPREM